MDCATIHARWVPVQHVFRQTLPCRVSIAISRCCARLRSERTRVDRCREGPFVDVVSPSYKGYRCPAEVIAHCVWLHHCFPLSFPRGTPCRIACTILITLATPAGAWVWPRLDFSEPSHSGRSAGRPWP